MENKAPTPRSPLLASLMSIRMSALDFSWMLEKVCRVVHRVSYTKGPRDLWMQAEREYGVAC